MADKQTCDWWWGDPYWASACGMAWQFNDGGPSYNQMKFCPGCGKSVNQLDDDSVADYD